jgi:hypothetical protein
VHAQVLRPLERSSLDRPESPVVVQGSRLGSLRDAPITSLRLYTFQGERLRPIPFQVDERTPEESYAYQRGKARASDTDDRQLDDNDELVFMAADVGDRLGPGAIDLGQADTEELRVSDPRGRGRGWVYLLRFDAAPPPLTDERYLVLDREDGELRGWQGPRVKVKTSPLGSNILDLREVRYALPNGGYGEDVLDRAKLAFLGSYLFLRIDRALEELRATSLAHLEGPIRLVASYQLEVYLIWGHWVASQRARLKLYHNRLELDGELRLPVPLESSPRSELRLSLDFLPEAGPVQLRTDTSDAPLPLGRTGNAEIPSALPSWICASVPTGAALVRLELPEHLRRPSHGLFLAPPGRRDPPEEEPGSHANVGYRLDLTGLERGDYAFRLVLQFGPSQVGRPLELLRVDDAPLRCDPSTP